MIDWFVLLVPLILLPILALLAFVGCILDREGTATHAPVVFAYEPGLADDLQEFKVTMAGSLFEDGQAQLVSGTVERGGSAAAPIDAAGEAEIPISEIALSSVGPLKCSGTALTQPANPPFDTTTMTIPLEITKTKVADEMPPTFTLKKDDGGNISIV